MISVKTIKKLTDKKHRNETGLFIVEGEKNISELLDSDFEITGLLGTSSFLDKNIDRINQYEERLHSRIEVKGVQEDDLVRSGTLISNNAGIAVAKQKLPPDIEAFINEAKNTIVLALDDVRDPGNLGTILRIADWYGVTHVIASPTTTDFYNPKTIAATMGSFTRISIAYTPLLETLTLAHSQDIPIIAACMDGENTHTTKLPNTGILLMGSESHGIHEEIMQSASHKVTIPRFGKAESLNVGVATGILLDTLRRT